MLDIFSTKINSRFNPVLCKLLKYPLTVIPYAIITIKSIKGMRHHLASRKAITATGKER